MANRSREKWLPVVGYDGMYLVSDWGNVKSRHTFKVLKQSEKNGYRYVSLRKDGKQKFIAVHRLVCEAFNGTPDHDGMEVDHLNFDKSDNRPENLEWVDRAENMRRAKRRNKAIVGESEDGACVSFPDPLSLENHFYDFSIVNRILNTGKSYMGFVWSTVD